MPSKPAARKPAASKPTASEARTLHRHGIRRVRGAIYVIGNGRYASLPDAVAQARLLAGAAAYFAN
ncbi:hypothetical protein [Novosphingobium sp.]|uniref:hypothetical protein n=1 Tax=Novosphingobium sp. TaxID=1874826 RepID=UPI0027371783|nr:hypothetical protein [Novosphingobium sp.]MDP3906537.1 hypothetical protein [Novosphingobium sp.]